MEEDRTLGQSGFGKQFDGVAQGDPLVQPLAAQDELVARATVFA